MLKSTLATKKMSEHLLEPAVYIEKTSFLWQQNLI